MKLLITGAGGFLGRYVVAEALHRGHAVRAMLRSSGKDGQLPWINYPQVEIVRADLRSRRGLADVVKGVDAVLHLAAAKSGDMYAQYAGTVVATENLLAAMDLARVRKIVLVSSFSVYAYQKIRGYSVLDEDSPVEEDAFERDEYAHTKLVQERLVREHGAKSDWSFTILRPGVIYGKDNLFTARLGMHAGRVMLRMGALARLPLTYVENCAAAIVMAAECEAASGQTLNVVDDEMPSQRQYCSLIRRHLSPPPVIVPIPLAAMRLLAGLAKMTNTLLLGDRAKIPGIFVPARLEARFRPLRFTNAKIKALLGWSPKYSLVEALQRSTTPPPPSAPTPAPLIQSPATAPAEVAA
jgi:nucleoside-diphosphate-sugar epimerase